MDFHKPVTLYSDNNPLTYITESATKTLKLMVSTTPFSQAVNSQIETYYTVSSGN